MLTSKERTTHTLNVPYIETKTCVWGARPMRHHNLFSWRVSCGKLNKRHIRRDLKLHVSLRMQLLMHVIESWRLQQHGVIHTASLAIEASYWPERIIDFWQLSGLFNRIYRHTVVRPGGKTMSVKFSWAKFCGYHCKNTNTFFFSLLPRTNTS